MLYFSKLRIVFITIFSLLFVLIASSNLFKFDDSFFDKKINLGLDLQGGSYLLLEIDNEPVICLLYTSPSPRDVEESRMPSSA